MKECRIIDYQETAIASQGLKIIAIFRVERIDIGGKGIDVQKLPGNQPAFFNQCGSWAFQHKDLKTKFTKLFLVSGQG